MNVGYFSKANAATRRLGFKSTLHVFDAPGGRMIREILIVEGKHEARKYCRSFDIKEWNF